MKITLRICLPLLLTGSLLLGGCETADQTNMLGQGMEAFGNVANLNPQQRAALQMSTRIVYAISDAQQREAERKAREALANASFRRTVARKHARYVAVPVHANSDQTKTKSKKVVVLYDTKENKVVDKAYAPAPKHYAEGEEDTFGGKEAVVSSSFSGV